MSSITQQSLRYVRQLSMRPRAPRQAFNYMMSARNMAAQSTPASGQISTTAKQDGVPSKGSAAAKMQSEEAKFRNFEQAAGEIGEKMQNAPENVTQEDAAYIESREARVTDTARPPPGSISAEAQRLASENARAVRGSGSASSDSADPALRSAQDRLQNFQQAASEVGSKMQNAPGSVTEADASYLHSREARAAGHANPPPGSLSSQAEHMAAVNEGRATAQSSAGAANDDSVSKSAQDRLDNFEQAISEVGQKMATNPEEVTKEDAGLLHSREQRAFGTTEKSGIAAQAHSIASQNEGKGS